MRNSLTCTCMLALLAQPTLAVAQDQHGHGTHAGHADFCDPAQATAQPVLGVADFDGSGSVDETDVSRIERAVGSGDYAAFFDLNADGTLDQADVDRAQQDVGQESSELDRQLAAVFKGTERYRDQQAAIDDGYIPYTPAAHGHGAHWAENPRGGDMGYVFEAGDPSGLNYAEDGRLAGVFFHYGPSFRASDGTRFPPGHDYRMTEGPPEGFAGDADVWHSHTGVCFRGLDFEDPTLDPSETDFAENSSPQQCLPEIPVSGVTRVGDNEWVPQFHMLHAWIYDQNPCGTFSGANPLLASDAVHPAEAVHEPVVDPTAPHPDFPFDGGTMCAWLAEADIEPEACQREG